MDNTQRPTAALKTYIIHYIENGDVFSFRCEAEDSRHALEQHKNANPNAGRVIGLKPQRKFDR